MTRSRKPDPCSQPHYASCAIGKDVESGWLTVGESRTDAGRRSVKLRGALRHELSNLRAERGMKSEGLAYRQTMRRGEEEKQQLRALVEGSDPGPQQAGKPHRESPGQAPKAEQLALRLAETADIGRRACDPPGETTNTRSRQTSRIQLPHNRSPEAADGPRTRDLKLGKLALYQLSYHRALWMHITREGSGLRPILGPASRTRGL
jgi:hypothetical protein